MISNENMKRFLQQLGREYLTDSTRYLSVHEIFVLGVVAGMEIESGDHVQSER